MSVLAGLLHLDGAPGAAASVPWVDAARESRQDFAGAHAEGPVAFRWQGFWTTPEAVIERLPVASPDRRLVLSYSGRIDNRDDLIARYGLPAAATDGELLAVALSRDGARGLSYCIGDFVLAAWDRIDRRLWLARDAIGMRPLYYLHDRDCLRWSTDFLALHSGAMSRRPNPGFLAEFLSGGVTSQDETVFDGIRRVPPAHALSFAPDHAAAVATEYWTPPMTLPPRRPDGDLIDEFRARFTTALAACVRTREPVAAELSGGLDSSSIVTLTAALTGAAPDTYSMVFPGTPFAPDGEPLDETAFIDLVTSAVGAASFRYDPRTSGREDVLRVLRAHGDLPDWPNADLVRWPMARAAAAAGHRVLLTGVGGDQWLTGTVARLPALIRAGHLGEAWRFYREATGPFGLEALRLPMLRRLAAAAAPPLVKRAFRTMRPARPWPTWLRETFVASTGLAARLRVLPSRVPAGLDAVLRDSLTRFFSADEPLSRESMHRSADDAGMEVRHPFFDRRMVEFVLTLPDDLRFRNGVTRYILRQAMRDHLPPAVAARRDKGDSTLLIAHAVRLILAGMPIDDLRVADLGWVDGDRVRAACAEVQSAGPDRLPQPHDLDLWAVIAAEAWLRAL